MNSLFWRDSLATAILYGLSHYNPIRTNPRYPFTTAPALTAVTKS